MIINKKVTKNTAIKNLRPDLEFKVTNDDKVEYVVEVIDGRAVYGDIEDKPSDAEIQIELNRLQKLFDSQAYARSRKESYPPITDYLDGIVKGDQTQIDKYISDCLAIKEKFPKE
jgi:hypothetical protein